jgi:hypothetical protein
LGASFGDTREDIDNNLAEYLTNSDITPSDPAIDLYIKGAINTEEEVLAAFRDIRGENYIPTVEEVSRYVGLTFSVGEDGKAAYDNLYEDMVSNITVDEQNALAEAVANGDQVAIDLVDAREDLDATQEAINAAHEAVLEAQRQAIDASDEAAAQEAINAAQEALAAVKEEADLKAKQDALDAAEEASAEAARLLANKQRADEAKALREREEAERARQAAEAARRDSMTPEERQAEDAARAGVLELDINYRQLQAEASRYDALTPAEQAAEDLLDPDVVSAQAAYDADPSDTNKSSLAAAKLRAPHRRSREEFYARNDLQDAEDAVDEIVRVSNLTPEEREAEEVAAAQEVAAAKAAQDAIDKAAEEAAEEARLVREATLLAAAKKAAEDAKLEAERVTALTIATNAAAKKQREEDYQAELTKALAIQSEANAEIAARVAANKLRWAEEDAAKRAERAAAEEKYAQEEAARKEAILATLEAARVAAAEARAAREAAAAQAAQDAADAAEKAREAAAAQEAAAAKAAQDAIDKAAEEAEIAAAEAKAAQDLLDAAEAERLANLTPEEQEEELEEELEEDRVSEITPEERTAEEAAIAFATQQKRIAVEQEFRRVWTSRFGSESGAETYLYDGENAIFSTFSNDVGGIEAFVNANTVTVDDVNAALALAGITDLSAMSDYGETSYGNFTGFKPKSVLQDKVDAFVPILQYTREEAEADLAEELMIPVADIPAEYNQYLTDIVDMSGATTRDMGKYTVQGSVWGKSDVYAIFGYGLYGKDPKDVYSDADAKQFVDQGQYTADLDRYRNGTTARLSQRSIINTMLSSLGYTATDNELDMLSRGIGGRSVANTQDLTTYVAGKSAGNSDTEIFESIETGHNAYLRKLIVDEFSRLEYTPTDADIESMLSSGTGSMGVANYINVNTVTEQEVDTFFNFYAKDFVRGENFDYSEFTGNNPQSELKGNIENYVAPRQYTREEAEADLAAELGLGRPLTTEELIPYEQFLTDIVDMSGTTTDVDGKLALESDIITEQDVRDYLLEIGYDNLAEKDFSLIAGNGLVDLEEATLGYQAANESVDQRNARLLAEQEAAADALKIANEAQDAADAAEKAAADLAAANAAAAVKLADTKLAFNDAFAGYDPTDAEIAAYLDNPDDIADYVASNTISEAEAIAALEATDFVIPEGFDFSDFTGKITEGQLATQISTSLAPLQYTRADAEAALATELGRPLTDDDLVTYSDYLDGLVDMTGATTNVIGDLAVQDDIVTADDVALYLSDLGYDTSNLTAEDLAGFASTGLNIELDTVTSAYQAENDTIAQEEANAAILAAANALNKPAELVTQADLDFVAQMAAANATSELSGQEVSYDVRYDLNNDGVVNYLDNQLLNELYAGEDAQYNTYVQGIDPNSAFANTGVFDTLAYDREQDRLSDIALQEEIDAQAALDAQIAQDLNTQLNIQTQATQDAQRRSLLYALAAEQGDKGKVPEIDTVPFKQRYNWESIFSSEQEELDRGSVTPYSRVAQEQEATSPYGGYEPAKRAAATGGLITDESDELLALLGLE